MAQCSSETFVFICQAGSLESKAALLAVSLRRFLPENVDLVAAIPGPADVFQPPSAATFSLLNDLGVRTVDITNQIDPAYPIGNKVSCLGITTDRRRLIFLDSDLILTQPISVIPGGDVAFAAKPADLPNIVDRRQWRRAYAAAGARVPDARVATTVQGLTVLPYFNAGFISVDPQAGLGEAWLDCCKRIDAKWGIKLKRPHLDQIALPVAVQKLQLSYLCLDERYNFPAHLKAIDSRSAPFFVHYHSPSVLRREPMLADLVRELCAENSALTAQLKADPEYAPLLAGRRHCPQAKSVSSPRDRLTSRQLAKSSRATPEVIITGIPRSGTSYLCNLLNRFENCVVLNEPDGIARPLRKEAVPHGVATFYRDIRRDVLEGRPIQNKLRDGKVTDETFDANELSEYVPTVESANFVVGMKNPLGFLSRLRGLRRAMPQARVAVCVRNPYDTIASWKTTFSHLQSAKVGSLWNGGLKDPTLSSNARTALQDIEQIKSCAWRRAAWWRYLAELILDAGQDIILVPYHMAVVDPVSIVERIMEGFDAGTLREPIEPSEVRSARRSALDDEDRQAIRALCGQAAVALGVNEMEPQAPSAPDSAITIPAAVQPTPPRLVEV